MRFLAGVASPLVPSLMYILERATEEGASKLAGVNAYSASVNFAYAFAGMIVGLFYSELGWTGLNLFSAAVAALALVVVWELAAENNDNGRGDGVGVILGDGEEKQERGGDAEVVSAAAVSAGGGGGGASRRPPRRIRIRIRCVYSIHKFFTHRPVSIFDRVPFQLTDELFLYGTTLRIRIRIGVPKGPVETTPTPVSP